MADPAIAPYKPQVGRADKHASNVAGSPAPKSSPVAMKNAAEWNKPGGGYDQFKQGDAARDAVKVKLDNSPVEPIGQ